MEFIHGLNNYERDNMMVYADNNENSLIFINTSNNNLSEKVLKLKQEMINPFVAFRDWLQEETLDIEAMQITIKQIYNLLETEEKLKSKLNDLEENLKNEKRSSL